MVPEALTALGRLLGYWGMRVQGSPGSSHLRLAVLATMYTRPSQTRQESMKNLFSLIQGLEAQREQDLSRITYHIARGLTHCASFIPTLAEGKHC